MCGLPAIDIADWMENTEYLGSRTKVSVADHQSCIWFWEVVSEFDHEMKARLLQVVTGTSGVPSRGFGVLQGKRRRHSKIRYSRCRPRCVPLILGLSK
jgi:E3 ubiquitin-protein ligase NEDD4